ncbi:MAG: NADPH-dependent FMN reductase [Acidobacteriota bacterium]
MPLSILGIAGSLRKGSYNRALLQTAIELAPPDLSIQAFERLAEIPPYDADRESQGVPEPVAAWKDALLAADGILIATPEYNHSVPGVLKNAIDWASRPAASPAYGGKPIAIMGATPGIGATIRAQLALRQALDMDSHVMPRPEVLIAKAGERFDAAGRLTDEPTRQHLTRFLAEFEQWVRRFRT